MSLLRFLGFLAVALSQVTPQGTDNPASRPAREALVQDATWPRLSFDEWLRHAIGPDARVTWEAND